jgi:hypothetical protein
MQSALHHDNVTLSNARYLVINWKSACAQWVSYIQLEQRKSGMGWGLVCRSNLVMVCSATIVHYN